MPDSPLSPLIMLATSMHAQPGVYAVLLGSGVSTGAGVPTGWGVVKDLVRRAAAADPGRSDDSQRLADHDPEEWWRVHGEGDLGYSTLLNSVAPTAAARQGLLARFFEPSDEDREQGLKVPSAAHHALAQLVKRGTVRVILTTNFDRLTEQALESAGVSPQVISRPEAINGMAPLAHADATLVKLHGDYKDLGSLNTPEELAEYPDAWTTLLRQVFDEYGLLICGWSGDWDTALATALDAGRSRRYPLFWDSRSSKAETAARLLTNRGGISVPAAGADELFTDLTAGLEALDALAQPPLTTAMAVERVKRYLPDPVHRIDLHDLVMDATAVASESIRAQPLTATSLDGAQIQEIWDAHLRSVTPLTRMLVAGVWHDAEGAHDQTWADVLQRLVDVGTAPLNSVTSGLDDARLWPALIVFTAMGVTAVRRDRERLVIRLATEVRGRPQMGTGSPTPVSDLLHPNRLLQHNWVNAMPRWGEKSNGWIYPSSHLLKADLRSMFDELIPVENDFVETFHGFEYRLSLIQEHEHEDEPRLFRALSGEFVGERAWSWDDPDTPLAEVAFREAAARTRDWPWPAYLEDQALDASLLAHREILKHYRRGW